MKLASAFGKPGETAGKGRREDTEVAGRWRRGRWETRETDGTENEKREREREDTGIQRRESARGELPARNYEVGRTTERFN